MVVLPFGVVDTCAVDESDHVTAVFEEPATVAVNDCDWLGDMVNGTCGFIVTETDEPTGTPQVPLATHPLLFELLSCAHAKIYRVPAKALLKVTFVVSVKVFPALDAEVPVPKSVHCEFATVPVDPGANPPIQVVVVSLISASPKVL